MFLKLLPVSMFGLEFCFSVCILKVRTVDSTWHDSKKVVRKDPRYSDCELLERSEKQKLYDEHIKSLTKKNREMFHRLLAETPEVTLTSEWRDVKKLIKEDPRYTKFSSSDRVILIRL